MGAERPGERAASPPQGYVKVEVRGVYSLRPKEADIPPVGVVILGCDEWEDMVLPIYIGQVEAEAIARALYNVPTERPLTHDLIVSILETLGVEVERVTIDAMINNIYTATLVLRQDINGRILHHNVDARPSDSLAIALRAGAPIFVSEKLRRYTVSGEYIK